MLESLIQDKLKRFSSSISFKIKDNIVFLEGNVGEYRDWVRIGLSIGEIPNVEGVVNNIKWKTYSEDKKKAKNKYRTKTIKENKNTIHGKYDVLILGGGVIGTAIARELSQYKVEGALVEKGPDLGLGASRANNGMIHPGVAPSTDSLKRKLNVKGNLMYDQLTKELNVKFKRVGSLWLITPQSLEKYEEYLPSPLYTFLLKYILPHIIKLKGLRNGVQGIKVLRGDAVFEDHPKVTNDALAAIYVPSTGILDPYALTIALGENAATNGIDIHLNAEVVDITMENEGVKKVITSKGSFLCNYIVNAAGLYADEVAELADTREYTIHPRKGAELLFHKDLSEWIDHCLAEVKVSPSSRTKGGGINPTVHGNIIWGPTAVEVPSKEDTSVTQDELETILNRYSKLLPDFPTHKFIRYFAGCRPATFTEKFIIRPAKWQKKFLHVAGIQSPGLTAAPAIAEYVVKELQKMGLELPPDPEFDPERDPIPSTSAMPIEELEEKITENPQWGNIVCTCEMVSEAEIVQAIKRDATSLGAIKRRTRALMGECQGSYCILRIARILSRELDIPLNEVVKEWKESKLFNGHVRDENL